MAEKTDIKQGSRRPMWVWVIAALFFVSSGYTILSYVLIYTGSVPLTPDQKAYFSSLSFLDHAISISISSLNITGAVLFFLLKRMAPLFLFSGFAIGILSLGYQIAANDLLSTIGGPGLIGAAIGQFFLAAVVVYSYSLGRRGILR